MSGSDVRLVPLDAGQINRINELAYARCIAPGIEPEPELKAIVTAYEEGITEGEAVRLADRGASPLTALGRKLRTAFNREESQ